MTFKEFIDLNLTDSTHIQVYLEEQKHFTICHCVSGEAHWIENCKPLSYLLDLEVSGFKVTPNCGNSLIVILKEGK